MPRGPLPPTLLDWLGEPRRAVVTTLRADGSPAPAATWYRMVDGRVQLSMEDGGLRARNLARDPRVALTALGDDWYTQVTVEGRAVEARSDPDLVEVDAISRHYDGRPYGDRTFRGVIVLVEIERWHAWGLDPGTGERVPRYG
jgi:PPOX class probable F420-dependent enzyme